MTKSNISLSASEKIGFISNLNTMLSAGIPIMEAVNSLLEDSKGNVKKVLETLRDDLTQGKHLYVTFSTFPKIFDPVTVSVIKASEEAGTLEAALTDIKVNIQRDMEFNDKIRSAMIYPLLIMCVFFGVLFMILIVVVPKISTVFGRMKVELPMPTKIMIFLSDQILKNTLPLSIGAGVFFLLLFLFYKSQKQLLVGLIIKLPLIRELVKEIDLVRFSRNLHLLLAAGLNITNALELTEGVMIRKDTAKAIKTSREMMISGKNLSAGLRKASKLIPTIMIKLIEVGEKTGSLEKSMQDVAEYLDYKVSNTLKTLTVLLEPLMLVAVGVCVGGMMLAIIAPIYGLIGQVGGAR